MDQIVSYGYSKNSNSCSVGLIKTAEQELAAFFNAVIQLFGKEQAELSAEDWLHELAENDGLPSSTHDWRLITVKASTRLAIRVNAPSLFTKFTNA
jgi:hypothetical protein